MSRIDDTKTRLDKIFLHDRAGIDAHTAEFLTGELRRVLELFFTLGDFGVDMVPNPDGSVRIDMYALGKRN